MKRLAMMKKKTLTEIQIEEEAIQQLQSVYTVDGYESGEWISLKQKDKKGHHLMMMKH